MDSEPLYETVDDLNLDRGEGLQRRESSADPIPSLPVDFGRRNKDVAQAITMFNCGDRTYVPFRAEPPVYVRTQKTPLATPVLPIRYEDVPGDYELWKDLRAVLSVKGSRYKKWTKRQVTLTTKAFELAKEKAKDTYEYECEISLSLLQSVVEWEKAAKQPKKKDITFSCTLGTGEKFHVRVDMPDAKRKWMKQIRTACALYTILETQGPERLERFLDEGANPNVALPGRPPRPLIAIAVEKNMPREAAAILKRTPHTRSLVASAFVESVGLGRVISHLLRSGETDPNVRGEDEEGRTLLHFACAQGDLGAARTLIMNTRPAVLLNRVDSQGCTPLHLALIAGSMPVATALVLAGADVTMRDGSYRCPIHIAVEKNMLDAVRLLESRGADISAPDGTGASPLHIAIAKGFSEIAKFLVLQGSDPNALNGDSEQPLHLALRARAPMRDVAEWLLAFGADTSTIDRDGNTAFHLAAAAGFDDIQYYMAGVDRSAALNIVDRKNGATPLYLACAAMHLRLVFQFLDNGADPNIATSAGLTPLHAYLQDCNDEDEGIQAGNAPTQNLFSVERTIQKFIAAGADITMFEASLHRTPVHVAISRGLYGPLSTFLQETPSAAQQSALQDTCLHLAVASESRKVDVRLMMAKLLLENRAEMNGVNRAGNTPLHLAVATGQVDMVNLLLMARAESTHWDAQGRCPIHVATALGRTDMVERFCIAKTDVNVVTETGETALVLAIKGNFLDIVRLLVMQGARVQQRVPISRESPLHLAVLYNHRELLSALLLVAPDIEKIIDQNGESALALCKRLIRFGDNDERAPLYDMLRIACKQPRVYTKVAPKPLIPAAEFCVDPSSMQPKPMTRSLDPPASKANVRRQTVSVASAPPSLPPRNMSISSAPLAAPPPVSEDSEPAAYENSEILGRPAAAGFVRRGTNLGLAAVRSSSSAAEPFYEEATSVRSSASTTTTPSAPVTALPARPLSTVASRVGMAERTISQSSIGTADLSSPGESGRPSPSLGTDEERRKKRERIEKDRNELEAILAHLRSFSGLIERSGSSITPEQFIDTYAKIRRAVNLTGKLDHRLAAPGPKEIVVFLVDSFAKAVVSGHAIASPVVVAHPPLTDKGLSLVQMHGGEGYSVFWKTLGENWN